MPIYEFGCLDCGDEFEKLVFRSTETREIKCPTCGSSRLEEKVSSFASASKNSSSGRAACAPSGG